jgi:predicted protein tyrosine phosphatase
MPTMQMLVCSRSRIETIAPLTVPHLLISIRTPGDPNEVKLPLNELTRGVLHLQFHDLDRIPEQPIPLIGVAPDSWVAQHAPTAETLFNEKMARQILDFVRAHVMAALALRAQNLRHLGVQAILVHCDAGWSRSPAVAAALTKTVFEQDDSHWFRTKSPNMLVYRTLLNVFHAQEPVVLSTPSTSTPRP